MTSRLRRRVLLTLGLIGLISISCRWYGERPTTSLAWLMIGIVSIALRLAVDRRHQRPYRGYAIGIEVVTRGAVLRLGQVTDLSLAVVVLYTILLITLLLSRMLWPVRRWTIPLLAMIAAGGLMMVPWSPTTFTPTSITNTLPRLQLYRVRQADDESLSVITSDGTRQIRSDQWTSLGSDALTIQYAAAQQHDNHVIIQLNTFTTLALAPQSALSLSYDDYVWSGSLEGTIARQTTDEVTRPMSMMTAGQSYILTGQGSFGTTVSLDQYTASLFRQAEHIADTIRPSSWTSTMIGASLLRLKLWGLSQIDPVYTDDLQQLYQYQCLIYGQRCDYVDTTRQDFSLHLSTRDADLQATTLSGSVEVGGLWESIKSVVGY